MPRISQRFGLEMPDDFPLALLEDIYARVRDGHEWPEEPAAEYAVAVNGILYRFRACVEYDDELRASLQEHGSSPLIEERYRQERALFGFYSSGLSALECLFYGAWFLGALNDPTAFDADIDRRDVTPKNVVKAFGRAVPGHPFTTALTGVNTSQELKTWRYVRNRLSHAGQPGRHFHAGGPLHEVALWLDEPLDSARTGDARRWLSDALTILLDAERAFVAERF
jgi:hypothetical protein